MAHGEAAARPDGLRLGDLLPPVDHQGDRRAPAGGFAVLMVNVDGEVVVAVRGDVDLATAPRLWRCLAEAIPEATERLVVDLAETTFIDSTALAVFVRAFKQLRDADGDLVLRSPNGTARKLLTITGLDRVMTIEG